MPSFTFKKTTDLFYAILSFVIFWVLTFSTTYFFTNTHLINNAWLVNALFLILLFRLPIKKSSPLLLMAFLGNFLGYLVAGLPLYLSAILVFCNILIIVPSLLFIPLSSFPIMIKRFDKQTLLLTLTILAGCLLSALVWGLIGNYLFIENFFVNPGTRFTWNVIGVLIIVPIALSINFTKLKSLFRFKKFIFFFLTLVCTLIIAFLSWCYSPAPLVLVELPLLFCAFQFDFFKTSIITGMVAILFLLVQFHLGFFNPVANAMAIENGHFFLGLVLLPPLIIALLIEQQRHSEAQLRMSEQRLLMAVEAGNVGIFEYDINKDYANWDNRMLQIYDIDPKKFTHNFAAWAERVHPDDLERETALYQKCLEENIPYDSQFRIILPSEEIRYVRARGIFLRSKNGRAKKIYGMNWDITSEKKLSEELFEKKERLDLTLKSNLSLQKELQHLTSHDSLTGLTNRFAFESQLDHIINTGDKNQPYCLCYMDLDHFKIINDAAGHAAGDVVLQQIASILQKNIGPPNILARLGGDEFALLLVNTSIEKAVQICEKIISTIQEFRFSWQHKEYEAGTSIGVVAFHPRTVSAEAIMSRADVAHSTAKFKGGNIVSVYKENDSESIQYHAEIQIIAGIKEALNENRFCLLADKISPLQPNSGLKAYYELLIRLIDKNGNIVNPSKFIPTAERYNLMSHIDEWVVKKVLIELSPKIIAHPDLSFSINLSANSLNSPPFLNFLRHLLETTPIPTERIGFELTETAVINHIARASEFLQVIQNQGCFVALDDFGTGLSSFNYLKHFPVKYVKIDGSFVRMMAKSPVDRAIVESINELAHKLDARTIAEYVETSEIMQILKEIGVDFGQGYAIAKTIPFDDLLE